MMKNIILIAIIAVLIGGGVWWYTTKRETPSTSTMEPNSQMLSAEPRSDIVTSDIAYTEGVRGYYAHPSTEGAYPGVVMIHEWWGLNDNIKAMARELAGQGYAVLAVDLYNGKVAANADEARALTGGLKQDEATANLRAASAYLRAQGSTKLASLGWCFGGGQSLKLATSGELLDATIIYYGQLTADKETLAKVKWPVLGIFGAKDTSIPVENVNAFETALNDLKVDNEVHIYEGVGHAFANPTGMNYAPQETKDAWDKTLNFLERTLRS